MTLMRLRPAFSTSVVLLCGVVCIALLAEAWLGYRATQEWQASSSLVVERRVHEGLDVLAELLARRYAAA